MQIAIIIILVVLLTMILAEMCIISVLINELKLMKMSMKGFNLQFSHLAAKVLMFERMIVQLRTHGDILNAELKEVDLNSIESMDDFMSMMDKLSDLEKEEKK